MLFFALWGIAIGVVLGSLTVAAVIPAAILALVIAGVIGVLGGEAFGPRTVELGLLIVGLQLGYLSGASLRSFVNERLMPAAKLFSSARSRSANSSSLRD